MKTRFIICGYSPRITEPALEPFLATGYVIALNESPIIPHVRRRMTYWFTWDSLHFLRTEGGRAGLQNAARSYIRWLPGLLQDEEIARLLFSEHTPKPIYTCGPRELDETPNGQKLLRLRFKNASVTAAADLALQMGAEEIYLVGVDYACPLRADQTKSPGKPQDIVKFVNGFFADFPVPVYRTHDPSPLTLEYRSLDEAQIIS